MNSRELIKKFKTFGDEKYNEFYSSDCYFKTIETESSEIYKNIINLLVFDITDKEIKEEICNEIDILLRYIQLKNKFLNEDKDFFFNALYVCFFEKFERNDFNSEEEFQYPGSRLMNYKKSSLSDSKIEDIINRVYSNLIAELESNSFKSIKEYKEIKEFL